MTTSIQQLPTIAAIASPIGQGGVGIIRLSGKDAYRIGQSYYPEWHILVVFMVKRA